MGKHHLPHGRRMEESCLSFIEERLILGSETTTAEVLRMAKEEYRVPIRTLQRWYAHFSQFGEYPFETKRRQKRVRYQLKNFKVTKIVTNNIISSIKRIVDNNPEVYLDEIQTSLCVTCHVHLSRTTIHCILQDKLSYSLQVCYEAARQRNEFQREEYKVTLESLMFHPNQVVFVDETHKDCQASRRRRAWGTRNSGGVALRRWFPTKTRYTMKASMDVDGFIDSNVFLEHTLRNTLCAVILTTFQSDIPFQISRVIYPQLFHYICIQ